MAKRIRMASLAAALGAACLLLTTAASTGIAAEPEFAGFQATGSARGLQMGFGFQDFVLEKIVDIGVPHSSAVLSSEGGAQARAVASQVFPGDVVAGAALEQFPGYREANYPANTDVDEEDDTNTVAALFRRDVPGAAGPLTFAHSRLITIAREATSSGRVVTQNLALSLGEIPLIQIGQLETLSEAKNEGGKLVHTSRTIVHDIRVNISPVLSITIGELRSTATSTTDGMEGTAEATIAIADVEAVLSGQSVRATIDEEGIRLVGAPEQAPPFVPQNLENEIMPIINQAAIAIRTASTVEIVEGAVGDASVGGLVIELSGRIPPVFKPDAVSMLEAQLYKDFPTICFQRDISPDFPLPLCVTPQLVPGPGNGVVASFAIGPARAAVTAAPAFVPEPPPAAGGSDGFVDGGVAPPTDSFAPTDPGAPQALPPAAGPKQGGPRFGLVARMHSGILMGTGLGFLVFAVALAMGPSLRRWRSVTIP